MATTKQNNKDIFAMGFDELCALGDRTYAGRLYPADLTGEDLDTYNELTMEADLNVRMSQVVLSDINTRKYKEFINDLNNRDRLRQYGLEPMTRILSYGASGTGKTLSAKALANELNYTMLMIDIAKALAQGNASSSISRVFTLANKMKYCVIFFDEVDAIAWNRDQSSGETGDVRRATNSLFQYLDQIDKTNLFIACTNMLKRLDAAFVRRFDLRLEFTKPELEPVEALLKFVRPEFTVVDDRGDGEITQQVNTVVKGRMSSVSVSYAAIENIAKREMKRAVLNGSMQVYVSEMLLKLCDELGVYFRFNVNDGANSV
jgi:AAA+ superfamily predicted ATPase